MKKTIFILIIGLLLIEVNLYAAGDLIVNGKVGIGTQTPSKELEVVGDIKLNQQAPSILFTGGATNWWIRSTYQSDQWGQRNNLQIGRGSVPGQDVAITVVDLFSDEPPFVSIRRLIPGQMLPGWGSENSPSFTFDGARTSGMYMPALNELGFSTAGMEQVRVNSSGNVGIGTKTPGSYKLYVNGAVYASGGYYPSDIRFKKDINPIESPLNKILNIQGVSYNWKTEEHKDRGFIEGKHYGVIGQEVEKVLPEVVKDGPNGEKSVSYTEMIPVLIEAIKEQQKTIEKQQKEIEALKTEVKTKLLTEQHLAVRH